MHLSLSAETLLLTRDPERGVNRGGPRALAAVAAAVLVELCLRERADVLGRRIRAIDDTPTGLALPDMVLADLSRHRRPRSLPKTLRDVRKAAPHAARTELVHAGVVEERSSRALGVFPIRHWPEVDPAPRREVRARLDAAVLHEAEPDVRTAALVALVHGAKLHRTVFPYDLGFREYRALKRRAAYLAAGSWAVPAVREMLQSSGVVITVAGDAGGGDGGGDGGGGG